MVVVDEELARVAELPVIPETESYVSGRMQLWATRDVANKKAELADKQVKGLERKEKGISKHWKAHCVKIVQRMRKAENRALKAELVLAPTGYWKVHTRRLVKRMRKVENRALKAELALGWLTWVLEWLTWLLRLVT